MARYGKYKNILHVIIATVLVSLWNSIVAAPIAMVVYGGIDGNVGTNLMIVGFQALGTDLASAAFLARIPANLVDKGCLRHCVDHPAQAACQYAVFVWRQKERGEKGRGCGAEGRITRRRVSRLEGR
ncbi:MAG: hypothetical protein ACLRWF_05515 [Ruthenibacterium sp.]